MTTTYPRIEKMMAGYINMDAAEISGSPNLNDQVSYYATRVSPKALRALLVELDQFESEHSHNLTHDFEEIFDYGANISDAKAFFGLVRNHVSHILDESTRCKASGQEKSDDGISEHALLKEALKRYLLLDKQTDKELGESIRSYIHKKLSYKANDLASVCTNFYYPLTLTKDCYNKNLHVKNNEEIFKVIPEFGASSLMLEYQLLHQLQRVPENMRITEEYEDLIKALWSIKGVDFSSDLKNNNSKPFAIFLKDLTKNQTRKLTR